MSHKCMFTTWNIIVYLNKSDLDLILDGFHILFSLNLKLNLNQYKTYKSQINTIIIHFNVSNQDLVLDGFYISYFP